MEGRGLRQVIVVATHETTNADLIHRPAAISDGPGLAIADQVPASSDESVMLPVSFTANGYSMSSLIFHVNYDEVWRNSDSADSDQSGIPDAIAISLPEEFVASVAFDRNDADAELDLLIADFFPLLDSPSAGTIVTTTFDVAGYPPNTTDATVKFSQEPVASFGTTSGQSTSGTIDDGSVLITPLTCADFSGPLGIDMEDVRSIAAYWRMRGTDPGWEARFDLDQDGDVDVADIAQVVARVSDHCSIKHARPISPIAKASYPIRIRNID